MIITTGLPAAPRNGAWRSSTRQTAAVTISAGIMTATGAGNKWHLETKYRWVNQYNFYLQDAEWGPMFVRVCPYFPFSTRICLNQHHWLAHQMKQAGIRFQQSGNAFPPL